MKQTGILNNIRRSLYFILVLSLILMVGCAIGTAESTDDQGNTKTEEGDQEQEPSKEDEPVSIGLTSFQTQDIYGGEFNQDIFQGYSLTLVNVWGTFCGPCLEEMPSLGELQKEYVSKGVNIVGIVVDVQDEDMSVMEDQRELAKEIAAGTGADYTHLLISEEMIDSVLNQFDAIPASFFVDSDGNIVSEFYIGSREKEDWVTIIEENIKNQQ